MKKLREIAAEAFSKVMTRAAEAMRRERQKPRFIPYGKHSLLAVRGGQIMVGPGGLGSPVLVRERRMLEALHRDLQRKPYSRTRETARRTRQIERGQIQVTG